MPKQFNFIQPQIHRNSPIATSTMADTETSTKHPFSTHTRYQQHHHLYESPTFPAPPPPPLLPALAESRRPSGPGAKESISNVISENHLQAYTARVVWWPNSTADTTSLTVYLNIKENRINKIIVCGYRQGDGWLSPRGSSYFHNVMTNFMINNRTDERKPDVNLLTLKLSVSLSYRNIHVRQTKCHFFTEVK